MSDVSTAEVNISGVKYQPWQGPFFDCDDKKVMVLGESFYHEGPGEPPSNINQIGPYNAANNKFDKKARRTWARHFRKIEKLFSPWSGSDPKEFWSRITYYNYIPESVGKTPGGRRTEGMWLSAIEPFKAVLLHLRPRRVLVLGMGGNGLWGSLLKSSLVKNADNTFPRLLDENKGPVLRVVGHPASHGFSTKLPLYQKTVTALLEWE